MEFRPVAQRHSLTDTVAQALLAAVHSGELEPGGRLASEAELARQFGVSRPVLREAVARLRADGLIISKAGLGLFVSLEPDQAVLRLSNWDVASISQVGELIELRRAVESESAQFAAERRTAADVPLLREALARIERASEAGEDGVKEDLAFHLAVARVARNQYFERVLEFLSVFTRQSIHATRRVDATSASYVSIVKREHGAVVDAIERGDGAAAKQAMRSHLESAWERLSANHAAMSASSAATPPADLSLSRPGKAGDAPPTPKLGRPRKPRGG